jgi:putative ABC transport system ATP-binding protein
MTHKTGGKQVNQVVELRGVSKTYGTAVSALTEIELSVQAGEFVAIMGPSGSGKSTLLNLVAGLDRPSSGEIVVAGQALGRLSESQLSRYRRNRLGIIFQFFHLLNNLSVLDNVLIPAQLAGQKGSVARARALELLAQLGIASKAGQYPARLSGGERQRAAIARALINQPALLLADEPTGALDSRNGEQVMELLLELHRAGQTIVQVTHDHNLAARYAQRVIFLRDGRVIDDTTMETAQPQWPRLVQLPREEAAQ